MHANNFIHNYEHEYKEPAEACSTIAVGVGLHVPAVLWSTDICSCLCLWAVN
jgi:hypothetical protein